MKIHIIYIYLKQTNPREFKMPKNSNIIFITSGLEILIFILIFIQYYSKYPLAWEVLTPYQHTYTTYEAKSSLQDYTSTINGKKKKKWVYNSEWMYPIFGSSKSETAYLCRVSNTCDDPWKLQAMPFTKPLWHSEYFSIKKKKKNINIKVT